MAAGLCPGPMAKFDEPAVTAVDDAIRAKIEMFCAAGRAALEAGDHAAPVAGLNEADKPPGI